MSVGKRVSLQAACFIFYSDSCCGFFPPLETTPIVDVVAVFVVVVDVVGGV